MFTTSTFVGLISHCSNRSISWGGELARALDHALGDSVGAQAPAPAAREPIHRLRRGSRHKVDERRVHHVDFLHLVFFNICRDFSLGDDQQNGRRLGRRVTRLPPLHISGAGREPMCTEAPPLVVRCPAAGRVGT